MVEPDNRNSGVAVIDREVAKIKEAESNRTKKLMGLFFGLGSNDLQKFKYDNTEYSLQKDGWVYVLKYGDKRVTFSESGEGQELLVSNYGNKRSHTIRELKFYNHKVINDTLSNYLSTTKLWYNLPDMAAFEKEKNNPALLQKQNEVSALLERVVSMDQGVIDIKELEPNSVCDGYMIKIYENNDMGTEYIVAKNGAMSWNTFQRNEEGYVEYGTPKVGNLQKYREFIMKIGEKLASK